METKERNHIIHLDVLRVIACILVILSHISSVDIDTLDITSARWKIGHIYNTLGHSGTILFLFISGTLLLSEQYRINYKKFYTNNFLRLITAYVFWIVLYHVIGLVQRGIYTAPHLKSMVIEILRGNASYHFWYLPMLMGIYLVLPMLRAVCGAGRRIIIYFTVLFLVIQVGFSTILYLDFPHKYIWVSMMNRIPFTLINHYVGYFILGYLLSLWLAEGRLKRPVLKGSVLILAGVILGLMGDLLVAVQQEKNSVQFNSLFSLTLCLSAVGIYLVFCSLCIKLPPAISNFITKAAELSFGIYLLHPLMITFVRNYIFTVDSFWAVISIPVMTILVFILTGIIIWTISKIPFLSKWII